MPMPIRKTIARSVSRRSALALATASLVGAKAAHAHHGWSGFDPNQTLRINGRIAAMSFDNPHGEVRLTTAGGEWSVELAPPSRMLARGLTAEKIAVGVDATIEGYPHRQTARLMRAERIVVAGQTTELR
jgi:hypothetical protein